MKKLICASILAASFGFSANASAETGGFELGLSAGYNYAMALNPVDGNATPEVVVDGHGFAVTISPGARITKYIGVYADVGLNLSYISKNKTIEETVFEKDDQLYTFTAMLALKFFQPLYNSEFFEGIALGYDYSGDTSKGEDPGSGFAVKASFGYLIRLTNQFKVGVACDVIANHKFERDYFNLSVDGQIVTVYHF